METVNKLSPKENFGAFCHKKAKGAGDEGFEAKAFNNSSIGHGGTGAKFSKFGKLYILKIP